MEKRAGHPAVALASYRRAVDLDGDDTTLLEEYARLLEDSGDLPAAAGIWQRLVVLTADQPEVHLGSARVLHKQGEHARALESAERALGMVLTDAQQKRGLTLKAAIMAALERPGNEIAEFLFKAGRKRGSNDSQQRAIAIGLFELALEYDPEYVPAYWDLAEALRMSSFRNISETDEQLALRARDIWEQGARRRRPAASEAWVYSTRALINNELVKIPGSLQKKPLLWWEAIAYAERSLLLSDQDAYPWTLLLSFYSELELFRAAIEVSANAFERGSTMPYVVENKVVLQTNIGEYDAALTSLKELEELLTTEDLKKQYESWIEGVRGYIAAYKDNYAQAVERITIYLNGDPDQNWARQARAEALSKLGEDNQAAQDWQYLYDSLKALEKTNDRGTLAWAASRIGKADEAIAIYEQLISEMAANAAAGGAFDAESSARERRNLGFIYLEQGQIDRGLDAVLDGIPGVKTPRQLDRLLNVVVWKLEQSPAAQEASTSDHFREAIDEIKRALEAHRSRIAVPQQPLDELAQASTRFGAQDNPGSWPWIGILAGQARILVEQSRQLEAAEIYRQLLAHATDRFWEAHIGLRKCVEQLQKTGDSLFKDGLVSEALASFEEIFVVMRDALPEFADSQADLHTRLMLAYLDREDTAKARDHLIDALHLYGTAQDAAPGKRLGGVCLPLLRDTDHQLRLLAAWQRFGADPDLDEALRGEIVALCTTVAPKTADELREAGDAAWNQDQPLSALQQYTQARTLVAETLSADLERLADLHSRAALAHFALGENRAMCEHIVVALEAYQRQDGAAPGDRLGTVSRQLLRDGAQHWALVDAWRGFAADAGTPEMTRQEMAQAEQALATYLTDRYQLRRPAQQAWDWNSTSNPVVLPIVVEVSDVLVPIVDSRQDGGTFLFQYIPAMRERIERDMGISVSGVRMRSNPALAPGSYQIQLNEAPVQIGETRRGMFYCPDAAAIDDSPVLLSRFMETPNPLTGEPGYWVNGDLAKELGDRGIEVWQDAMFLIYHMEAVLRRNLALFVEIQQVDTLLGKLKGDDQGATLIKSVLGDQTSRIGFARILRTLVNEQISIVPLREILSALQGRSVAPDQLSVAIREVRLALKRYLPGNNGRGQILPLPSDIELRIEQGLTHPDGNPTFSLPPDEMHTLLLDINTWLPTNPRSVVLMVRNAELRPFVRRLVEFMYPDLMVLAQDEALPPDGLVPPAAPSDAAAKGANAYE
jgi:tetratricopeptide (TPR) repeat protein